VEVSDPVLVKLIATHPHLGESDYRVLETWWLLERQPGEGAVEFLIRQGVFVPDAVRSIDMLRRGILTFVDPRRLFGEQGHQRLREYGLSLGMSQPKSDPQLALTKTPPPAKKAGPAAAPPAPAAAPSGDKLAEVRQWLARRAEEKQAAGGTPGVATPSVEAVTNPPSTPPGGVAPVEPPPRHGGRNDPPSMPPQAANPLERTRFPVVGDQYGKYFLTEELGRGAAAVVFRAFNRTLNNTVALKVLKLYRPGGLSPEHTQLLEGLRQEAQLLARFDHPNLVRVFDLVEDTSYPFLVLEHVDGMSLHDLLRHSGRLRLDRTVKLITAIAEGLAAAQRKIGLVHRDVKPANILLARDGGIKLADLGLAVISDHQFPPTASQPIPTKNVVGTIAYMAPEQCNSEPVDHRADIYSLGATFYHAVVGDMPFRAKSRLELILKQTRDHPVPPHDLVPGLDPAVSEVILCMMRKDPNTRYPTYDDLLNDLQLLHTGSFDEIQLPAEEG
jgi:tRNA A-37 threonylcarbamoyl transferase component Bud32